MRKPIGGLSLQEKLQLAANGVDPQEIARRDKELREEQKPSNSTQSPAKRNLNPYFDHSQEPGNTGSAI